MTSATLTRSHIQRTLEFGIVAASENGASCISFAGNNLAARTRTLSPMAQWNPSFIAVEIRMSSSSCLTSHPSLFKRLFEQIVAEILCWFDQYRTLMSQAPPTLRGKNYLKRYDIHISATYGWKSTSYTSYNSQGCPLSYAVWYVNFHPQVSQ